MATAVLILASLGPASMALAQTQHKQVLVLYATRRDAQFAVVGEGELPRILDTGLNRNLDYYAEFIDITRFPQSAYKAAFRDFLRQKYQNVSFDLVIAMQDVATEFLSDHGGGLFGDTPAVFLANTPMSRRPPNSTGLIHERDFAATFAFIRQLQPDVRDVFIVTGNAPADEQFEDTVRRQLPSNSGVEITYLSGLPTKELESRLSTLPGQCAVYYLLVSEDGAGNKFHPLEYIDRVAAVANAPVYSWVDSTIGRGVVGGSVYSQSAAIERVGALALRVLRGEPVDSIPVAKLHLNTNMADWRQLQRWGIDEGRLPPGTLVQFRNPTIWDRYKGYILVALALLVTQSVLIAGLLIQRVRRRRAEEDLLASQGELRRSYERNRDLGARLLRAQDTERSRIARELHDDICQRMSLLTFELESLGHGNEGDGTVGALTAARDIAKSLHELSHQLHPTRLRLIGLVGAIDRLRHELSRTGVAITFTHDNVPPTLPPDSMLCLFRVVQEALQNAIKYSDAKTISVHLSCDGKALTLTIVDDGVGFDVDAAWNKGLGLVSMVERLEMIGGSLEIHSRPGIGTRLTATAPCAVAQQAESRHRPSAAIH